MSFRIAINKLALDKKIPRGDKLWGTFNDRFVNQEIDLMDFANAVYTGHAFTSWHKGRRCTENFECSQFIAVDMDTEDERSSFSTLERHELVALYAGMMYTTPQHTDERPRARIIFFLDTPLVDAQAYTEATRFVTSLFDGADTNCAEASRFFYGAKGCTIWLSEHVLPLAQLRGYYARWKAKQPKTQPKPKRQDTPADLKDVESALKRVNPWGIDYNQWIAVLAALHDNYGDSALPLAIDWGQGEEGEVERKWKSFGRYRGKPASVGTIFHLSARSH